VHGYGVEGKKAVGRKYYPLTIKPRPFEYWPR
jgi:hypothetical protein